MYSNFSYVTNDTCESTYSGKIYLSDSQRYFLIGADSIVMLLNIVANSAVMYALVATNQLKNISLQLILFLSISDCSLGLISQPLFAVMLAKFADRSHCNFESIVQFFVIFIEHISAYIIGLIAIDRYCRMKYLTNYSQVMKGSVLLAALIFAIFLSFIQGTLYVSGTLLNFFGTAKKAAVAIDFIIAISILGVYLATILVIRQHRRNAVNRDLLSRVDKTITSLASSIMLAILLFYIPYVFIAMTHSSLQDKISGEGRQWLTFTLFLCYVLTYCNSFTSAFIFMKFNKPSRSKLMSMFSTNTKDQESSNVVTLESCMSSR